MPSRGRLAEPLPAKPRVLSELQIDVAIVLDHARAMLADDARAVVARSVDHEQLVAFVHEQRMHARERWVVERFARIAAAVASEQHAVAERILTDVEDDPAARPLDFEPTGEIALVADDTGRRAAIHRRSLARALRAEDVALTKIGSRQAEARIGSGGAVLELVEVNALGQHVPRILRRLRPVRRIAERQDEERVPAAAQ